MRSTRDAESTGIWFDIATEIDLGPTELILVPTVSLLTLSSMSQILPTPLCCAIWNSYVTENTLFYMTNSSWQPSQGAIQLREGGGVRVTIICAPNPPHVVSPPSSHTSCTPNLDTARSVDPVTVLRVDKWLIPITKSYNSPQLTSRVYPDHLF